MGFSPEHVSLLDDIYGDDNRSVLDVALDQATPNRISKAWVRHRVEEVIGQLSTVLDDEQLEPVVEVFEGNDLP